VRVIHPMISRHFRHAAHPDEKTDATDLEGIVQATCNGYGLVDPPWEPIYCQISNSRLAIFALKTRLF
jgi:hypothetical protein